MPLMFVNYTIFHSETYFSMIGIISENKFCQYFNLEKILPIVEESSLLAVNCVRSKPPEFSLQVDSSRSRPRQLQLPWSTSEEKPEIRESRSPGCLTETA